MPTRGELFAMLEEPADVIGEGPVLLIIVTPYEGLRLQRYSNPGAASVDWLNYTGPGRAWLFEVGQELGFEELPPPRAAHSPPSASPTGVSDEGPGLKKEPSK